MYSPASYPLGVEPESVVHEAAQRRARVWAMSMADRRMCERPAILSPISGQRLCHLDDMDTREAITLDRRAQQRLDVLNHVLAGEPQPARADEPDRAAGAGRRQPPRLARSGPWLTLVGAIDNATGIVIGAVFREQEDGDGDRHRRRLPRAGGRRRLLPGARPDRPRIRPAGVRLYSDRHTIWKSLADYAVNVTGRRQR